MYTQELAVVFAGMGGLIMFFMSNSQEWASFEAYKRAAMAMHHIGCGNECTTLSTQGLLMLFVWLIFSSSVGS